MAPVRGSCTSPRWRWTRIGTKRAKGCSSSVRRHSRAPRRRRMRSNSRRRMPRCGSRVNSRCRSRWPTPLPNACASARRIPPASSSCSRRPPRRAHPATSTAVRARHCRSTVASSRCSPRAKKRSKAARMRWRTCCSRRRRNARAATPWPPRRSFPRCAHTIRATSACPTRRPRSPRRATANARAPMPR